MTEFWFDTRTGDQLIGEAAIAQRMEESAPGDIVPLRNLLTKPDFSYSVKDFQKAETDEWAPGDYRQFGQWALKILQDETTQQTPLTHEVLERLYTLGIGPYYNYYLSRGGYDNLAQFQADIGAPINRAVGSRFSTWTRRDFVEKARELEARIGRKPTKPDYVAAAKQDIDFPPPNIITQRMTLSELNEDLGYPDIRQWSYGDYIEYGCRVSEVNGIERLDKITIEILSGRKRGPGYTPIYKQAGSWENFKFDVIEKLEGRQAERQEKLDRYKDMIIKGALPESFAELSEALLLKQAARFLLVHDLAPNLTIDEKTRIARLSGNKAFVAALIRIHPGLTAGAVEMRAERLDIVDDIWPNDDYKKYLKVTDNEIEEFRAKRNQKFREWYNRKKAS